MWCCLRIQYFLSFLVPVICRSMLLHPRKRSVRKHCCPVCLHFSNAFFDRPLVPTTARPYCFFSVPLALPSPDNWLGICNPPLVSIFSVVTTGVRRCNAVENLPEKFSKFEVHVPHICIPIVEIWKFLSSFFAFVVEIWHRKTYMFGVCDRSCLKKNVQSSRK